MEHHRAYSVTQPANLAKAIDLTLDGLNHLLGSILSYPCTAVARTLAVLGYDFIFIDAEHSAIHAENLAQLIQIVNSMSEGRTCVIVRVPNHHSSLVVHALNAGAAGIVFPHVETAKQARAVVARTKYSSFGGTRSLSPFAHIAGITDGAPPGCSHESVADEHIAVICQIESALGIENADSIALTPGVNALILGSADLRLSLGVPWKPEGGDALNDPRFINAVTKLFEVSNRRKKALLGVSYKLPIGRGFEGWIKKFGMVLVTGDARCVINGHLQDLKQAKDALGRSQVNGH